MSEVNKELLRNLALEWIAASEKVDTTDDDDDFLEFNAVDEVWQVEASGDTVLALLDENAAQSARIAELERECERLRKEVDKRIDQGRISHEMLNNVLRENAELRGELSVLRSSEAHELGKVRAELEDCRKDAQRWRYFRDRLGEPVDGDVFSAFNAWLWADASIEDVEAAIDAAMQEGGV